MPKSHRAPASRGSVGGRPYRRASGPNGLQISKDGIIIGGSCDNGQQDRYERECGCRWLWNLCIEQGCIEKVGQSMLLTLMPEVSEEDIMSRGATREIGIRRFRMHIITELLALDEPFTMEHIEKAIVECSARDQEGGVYQEGIYQKRKARGDFASLTGEGEDV